MMQRFSCFAFSAALGVALATAGCNSAVPGPGSPSYKAGQLGNGGFAFSCDDSVACDRYTNSASTFPDAVATGSTFRVQYIPKDTSLHINESAPGQGVTIGSVGNGYLGVGDKLTALKPGWATVATRNPQGSIVEFITVKIVRPDALTVYDGAYTGSSPTRMATVQMRVGEVRTLRALARAKQQDLAGALNYDWTGQGDGIVDVTPDATGKVTLVATKAGTSTITVEGGGFKQDLTVQVTQ